METRTVLADIKTPASSPSLSARLIAGPVFPRLAARFAAGRSAARAPWRIGSNVLVVCHAHVCEALERDLDFAIAPINAQRIGDVDDWFVLGMDRQPVLVAERQCLYRAFSELDFNALRVDAENEAVAALSGRAELEIIGEFARSIAAKTAQRLFGIAGPDLATFQEVARAIFGHTFLNLSNDARVRERAIKAAKLLEAWLNDEIKRRRERRQPGSDMMGRLLAQSGASDDLIRRTLAGMLVGAIDTTATAVAKVVAVMGRDPALKASMETDSDNLSKVRGWCFEALRRWPHNPILLRRASRDTSLAGAPIRAGDRIVLWTQAAMQDASAFPDPERMRPDRPASAYLHFGHALHRCAGRTVNEWQVPLLVSMLVRRGIDRVGSIRWAGPFPDQMRVSFA